MASSAAALVVAGADGRVAELGRGDREHAAAGAPVGQRAGGLEPQQQLEREPGRLVRARAERLAGLDDHVDRARVAVGGAHGGRTRSAPLAAGDVDRWVVRAPARRSSRCPGSPRWRPRRTSRRRPRGRPAGSAARPARRRGRTRPRRTARSRSSTPAGASVSSSASTGSASRRATGRSSGSRPALQPERRPAVQRAPLALARGRGAPTPRRPRRPRRSSIPEAIRACGGAGGRGPPHARAARAAGWR